MASIFKIERVDLINSVVVAIILTIYLSFILNRLFTFRQAKLEALKEMALLTRENYLTESWHQASIQIAWFLEIPVICLASDEQWGAAGKLKRIRDNLRSHLRSEFDNLARLQGIERRDDLRGEAWLEGQREIYNKSRLVIRSAISGIQSIEPSWLRILGLIPSNTTLNKWDRYALGRVVTKVGRVVLSSPERWKRFQAYLNGEAEDF